MGMVAHFLFWPLRENWWPKFDVSGIIGKGISQAI